MLCRALPHVLTTPKPLYEDRRAQHYNVATCLRVSQAAKRNLTQQKRKATLAAKKAKKDMLKLNDALPELEPGSEDSPDEDGEGEGVAGISTGKRKR